MTLFALLLAKIFGTRFNFWQLCQGNSKIAPNSWLFGLTNWDWTQESIKASCSFENHKPLAHLSIELSHDQLFVNGIPKWRWSWHPATTHHPLLSLRDADTLHPELPWLGHPIDLCFLISLILDIASVYLVHVTKLVEMVSLVSTSLMKRPQEITDNQSKLCSSISRRF